MFDVISTTVVCSSFAMPKSLPPQQVREASYTMGQPCEHDCAIPHREIDFLFHNVTDFMFLSLTSTMKIQATLQTRHPSLFAALETMWCGYRIRCYGACLEWRPRSEVARQNTHVSQQRLEELTSRGELRHTFRGASRRLPQRC